MIQIGQRIGYSVVVVLTIIAAAFASTALLPVSSALGSVFTILLAAVMVLAALKLLTEFGDNEAAPLVYSLLLLAAGLFLPVIGYSLAVTSIFIIAIVPLVIFAFIGVVTPWGVRGIIQQLTGVALAIIAGLILQSYNTALVPQHLGITEWVVTAALAFFLVENITEALGVDKEYYYRRVAMH